MATFLFRGAVVFLLAAIWGALNRLNSRAYETNTTLSALEYQLARDCAHRPGGSTGDPDTAVLERG